MSRSEMSLSPSMAIVACEASDMLPHKRVRRPWATAIDPTEVVPAACVSPEERLQPATILLANENRSVPYQSGLACARLTSWSAGDSESIELVNESSDVGVELARFRLHLG